MHFQDGSLSKAFSVRHFSQLAAGGAWLAAQRISNSLNQFGIESQNHCLMEIIPQSQKISRTISAKVDYELMRASKSEMTISYFKSLGYSSAYRNIYENSLLNEIIHLHWTAGAFRKDFINLLKTPKVLITAHDMHLTTGLCHHSFKCENFIRNCEQCPQVIPLMRKSIVIEKKKRNDFFKQHQKIPIVFPSEWLKKQFEKNPSFSPGQLHVIRNPVEPVFFGEKRFADSFIFRIGILGSNYDTSKGSLNAVEILNRFQFQSTVGQTEVLVIGTEHKTLNLNQIIEVPPSSSSAVVSKALRKCDVFLFMSEAENLPSILLECQAAGTPVIALDAGGTGETFLDGKTGFLISHSTEQALVKLELMRADTELRKRMSSAASMFAQKNFHPRIVAELYANLYANFF